MLQLTISSFIYKYNLLYRLFSSQVFHSQFLKQKHQTLNESLSNSSIIISIVVNNTNQEADYDKLVEKLLSRIYDFGLVCNIRVILLPSRCFKMYNHGITYPLLSYGLCLRIFGLQKKAIRIMDRLSDQDSCKE